MLIIHKYCKLSKLIESFIQMVTLFSTLHPNHFKQIFYYYHYYYCCCYYYYYYYYYYYTDTTNINTG